MSRKIRLNFAKTVISGNVRQHIPVGEYFFKVSNIDTRKAPLDVIQVYELLALRWYLVTGKHIFLAMF